MSHPTPRVLVIGAGPVGLAAARALREVGLHPVHVEATDHVGGNWAHGVYETAHIISSRRTTEYDDFPMPEHWPDFPSADQMRQYFVEYAQHFDLVDHIRFQTRVEAVRPQAEGWSVRMSEGREERFDAVVVCNGHHWKREWPAWADPEDPRVMHSKDYKRPEQLRGKRVLVVGGGNSGCDLVSEAARVGVRADWSLRRGVWLLPKTLMGKPTVEMVHPWMPVPVQRLLLRALLRVAVGDYAAYGLPKPDHRLFEAHPTVSTEALHYLKHGRIHPRPDVADVEAGRVCFADGSAADYDLIVCATGFGVAFPFLPPGMVPVRGKTPQLLGGMLRPEHRHLYIMGAYQVRYGLGPLVRPASVLMARWLLLQEELEVPLGAVLQRLGMPYPSTHLVDPHAAIRRMRRAHRLEPLLRAVGRRMSRRTSSPEVARV